MPGCFLFLLVLFVEHRGGRIVVATGFSCELDEWADGGEKKKKRWGNSAPITGTVSDIELCSGRNRGTRSNPCNLVAGIIYELAGGLLLGPSR